MAYRVGQQLGNYRLERMLGRGGFAEVYLGRHVHLDTLAAVKVLHTELSQTDVTRFRNEARTLVHLIHPHIVRLLDYGVEGNIPFLVMDYAPNGSLRQHHPKGLPLPLDTIISYVKQIASALQFAHDGGLVHRDIKPENMLLGRNHELLLSDFGIALVAQNTYYASRQEMAGTIAYMAPEQIQARPQPASDQYALGIVVYEWLSGEYPFNGSFAEIAAKHAFISPPSLSENNLEIPPAVDEVVRIALEKSPYKRFASVQAFAKALEEASKPAQLLSIELTGAPTLITPAVRRFPRRTPFVPLGTGEAAPSPKEAFSNPVALQTQEETGSYSTILAPELSQSLAPHSSYSMTAYEGSHFYSTIAMLPSQVSTPVLTPSSRPEVRSHQHTTKPQKTRQATSLNKKGTRNMVVGGLLALVMLICVFGWLVYTEKVPAFLGFAAGTTQVMYPNIAGNYNGPIHNTRANIFAPMSLSITQNSGSISGTFDVGNPLKGNGSFTGTIDTTKHIRFLVRSDKSGQTSAPILFWGGIQPDKSLSGNYCSINRLNRCGDGGYGVWNVSRK